MLNLLILVTYAMAAALVAGLVGLEKGLPLEQGGMLAVLGTVAMAQIHLMLLRRKDRKRNRSEIAMLKQAGLSFQQSLDVTSGKIAEITQLIETRTDENNRKIVAELQILEGLMREFAGRIAGKAKAVTGNMQAALPQHNKVQGPRRALADGPLLELIRTSLEQNRVDLYLQPTVSLPQRKLRYYEALSRLRAEDGTVIMPAQYMRIAAPAGLMSVVDNLLLFRCVQIVRKLTVKNRDIAIFCNIAGDTLSDAEFFPQFLEYMHHNRDLAGQIVFEFSQSALAKAGAAGEANLGYLSNLGFALSLDHVETLALDFGRLRKLGFRHIKVHADLLTGKRADSKADVAAEDLKTLMARQGMNLIAERVEDEKTVLQLLDYGVDFAQGYLFGEPRAVREEAMQEAARTATAAVSGTAGPEGSVVPLRRAG